MHHFKIDFQGYLPSHMLGYALALFAYARGETRPAWARYLRLDAAEPFKTGLRYVLKTRDSLFHPETAQQPVIPPTEAEVIERLTAGSATVRAMTLRDVANLETPPITLLGAVVSRLRDRDTDVRIEAARALPRFGEAAGAALADLIPCLTSTYAPLRTVAAAALPGIGGRADLVVPELTRLLEDPDTHVAETAADGLRGLAPSAASAVPALVEAIRKRGRLPFVGCLCRRPHRHRSARRLPRKPAQPHRPRDPSIDDPVLASRAVPTSERPASVRCNRSP